MWARAYSDMRARTATLTGADTLTVKSFPIQVLDPGGAHRDVTLPAESLSQGYDFTFVNSADAAENLVIKTDAGSTLVTVGYGQTVEVFCDGTTWRTKPVSGSFTSATLVTPTLSGAATLAAGASIACLAGVSAVDLSLGTGVFKTTTGVNTLGGHVEVAAGKYLKLLAGAGYIEVDAATSGGIKILPTAVTGFLLTVTTTEQTVGTATLTIPDFANVSDTFAFCTLAQTFAGIKTFTGGIVLSGAVDLVFSGTSGQPEIVVPDNVADALSIKDSVGGADILVITTSNGSEVVTITPALTVTGLITSNGGLTLSGAVDLKFSGTTGQPEIVVPDNVADALSVKDDTGGADILVITTTNGAEAVTVTPVLNGRKIQPTTTAVTATADGLTTGLIPANASHVTVTSDNADKIITLPAAVAGTIIRIHAGSTGCELRTVAASNVKINDVDADGGAAELALVADALYTCVAVSTTEWIVTGCDKLGAALAALVPDAV